MVRADPDVIMVGEIRDRETAQIAIESALTGHLVLTTLHTNDAPLAAARLVEMGIEPYLVASGVACVVAQRLVRRLCDCKKPVELSKATARGERLRGRTRHLKAFEPVGCVRCGQTGYKGRTGLYEVMPMTDELRRLILDGARHDELRAYAREQGMRTLREDGLEKVAQGVTSVPEVLRVLGASAQPLDAGRAARRRVRGVLELVAGQRLELDAERQLDQAVGEPDVLRQQRAVQVGADHVAAVHALEAVAAVVAVAREHAAERLLAGPEVGAPAVVLEAGDHARPGAEVGLDRAVADQPRARLADGAQVDEARRRAAPRRPARTSGRAAGSRRTRRARRRRGRRPRGARRAWSRPCRARTATWSRSWPPPM